MFLIAAFVAWVPLLLVSEEADRLNVLVEELQRLTFADNHAAVGRLVPAVREELAKPHSKADIGWNQVGVYLQTQGDFAEAERADSSKDSLVCVPVGNPSIDESRVMRLEWPPRRVEDSLAKGI